MQQTFKLIQEELHLWLYNGTVSRFLALDCLGCLVSLWDKSDSEHILPLDLVNYIILSYSIDGEATPPR